MKIVRVIQNLKQSDPLGQGIFSNLIPKNFPKDYPQVLRLEALKSLRILIKILDGNILQSTYTDKRKIALQHELFFFTKGKEGIKGKHSKKNPDFPVHSIKNSKKTSKKSSKKSPKKSSKNSSKKTSKKSSKKSFNNSSKKTYKTSKKNI